MENNPEAKYEEKIESVLDEKHVDQLTVSELKEYLKKKKIKPKGKKSELQFQ